MPNTEHKKITKKFSSGFRWSICGSIIYELSKILHQTFLLKTMESSLYGLMGSIFSIIYLIIYLTDFGLCYSLPTFLNIFTKNKNNFKKIFIKIYLLPQILIITLSAFCATYFYSKSFLQNTKSPFIYLIPLIIIFESIRIFFRRFFHNVFMSRITVITETILMILYLTTVWIPYLFLNFRMTTNLIFMPYLLNSIVCVIIFIFLLIRYYNNLPQEPLIYPANLLKKILKIRFFNYSIHVSKNFFTGNFLTPFFAAKFGLSIAGVFNLANHIAESIKAIMTTTIIFSGNAMIANLKSATMKIKREAFKLLFQKLNIVIYPIAIFLLINYKNLIALKGYHSVSQATLSLAVLFLFISLSEYFFLIYEQFYIIQEHSGKLFLLKLFEFTLFYGIILSNSLYSPFATLLIIMLIKIVSFSLISITAYSIWKIKPNFSINKTYLISYFVISILFFYYLNKLC